jgi:hypothetical protein
MASLGDHGEAHSVTEVKYLLHLLLPTWECGGPLFIEAAYSKMTLKGGTYLQNVRDGIGGVGALYSIEVPCMHSVNDALHRLHQVEGRGLLGHPPLSIPDR